jgi:hypothetical protein
MGVVATFDSEAFKAAYPQFATLSDAQLVNAFNQATLYLANDGTGPVSDVATQTTLLWLLTAHVSQLIYGTNGQAPSGLVGRVSSASEGSVSVSTDLGGLPGSASWFAQTGFGLSFWQATARFRTARYIPGFQRPTGFWPYGVGRC